MSGTGEDVIGYAAKSEEYYSSTLKAVLPSVTFVDGAIGTHTSVLTVFGLMFSRDNRHAGGYITRCVTSRTSHGDPLIGALRLPYESDVQCGAGLFACAGCNGTGAKFALEWGACASFESLSLHFWCLCSHCFSTLCLIIGANLADLVVNRAAAGGGYCARADCDRDSALIERMAMRGWRGGGRREDRTDQEHTHQRGPAARGSGRPPWWTRRAGW